MFENETWRLLRNFDAGDGGSGGGTGTGPGENPVNPPADGGTPPAGGNGDPNKPGDKKPSLTAEQQKAVNDEVGRIRAEMRSDFDTRWNKKVADEAEAAKKKQEADQGNYKKLYEDELLKTQSLEAKAALAETYAASINGTIDEIVKDWPAALKKLDPGKDNVEARMAWANNSLDLANQLLSVNTPPDGEHGTRGNGGKPTPSVLDGTNSYLGQTYRIPGREPANQGRGK